MRLQALVQGLTIVAVDDDRGCREALALLLGDLGADVRTARSGAQALRMIQDECPDLVLTDLMMPGMCGADLLARLRQDHPTLPVVAVSAVEGSQTGSFDALLGKPFDYDTLRDMLQAVTRQRPALVQRQCRCLRETAVRLREEAVRKRTAARAAQVRSAAAMSRASRRQAVAPAA